MRLPLARHLDLASVEDPGGEWQSLLVRVRGDPARLLQHLEDTGIRAYLVHPRMANRAGDLHEDDCGTRGRRGG